MGIDILEHCKKVRSEHGPPYTCPIDRCSRTYKSVCGLQYHLKSFDHENPAPATPPQQPAAPRSNKKGHRKATPGKSAAAAAKPAPAPPPPPEPLTYDEAQRMVQFEIGGQPVRVDIDEALEVYSADELPPSEDPPKANELVVSLPEASFRELEDYNICDAPPRPNAYVRFIEKSAEELDGEVEYDVDEEDTAWLSIMNEKRDEQGLPPVSVDSLELLMDRLEKESYFQAAVNGQTGTVVDDDAVCCICMDGECQNTNVILFCDMCNLAVHQDCYGVPYIPEGQWLCRRCLQSPSRAVDCVLCPNQGGAFKQTDRAHWAHVVCALWIPEVRFANTVFLEPIDSIETIPPARWKLTCYVCKQRGVGACIQCHKTNCYSAFHVTCAQQAGLYMKMDTVNKEGGGGDGAGQPLLVQKIAYCDVHAPADFDDSKKEDVKQKMKQARKLLAKKRTSVPVILIPTIPPERIQEVASLVAIQKKSQFVRRLIAYWTLKRQFRNGVPLLRRLQSAQDVAAVYPPAAGARGDPARWNVDASELIRQLKYWQCLRQDLERARLLCELVRKREKLKAELIRAKERCLRVQLKPLEASLRKVLDLVASRDVNEIFLEPVDLDEVPDYGSVVKEPMDLSTMMRKLDDGEYADLRDIEKDFELMIANCLAYNNKDTVFYKAALKMRDQCTPIFKQAQSELSTAGLMPTTPTPTTTTTTPTPTTPKPEPDPTSPPPGAPPAEEPAATPAEVDRELEALRGRAGPAAVARLERLLDRSRSLRHGTSRLKRCRLVRAELARARKQQAAAAAAEENPSSEKGPNGAAAGVNRRTAVLHTKKARVALGARPEDGEGGEAEEEEDGGSKLKKKGRQRRSQDPSSVAVVECAAPMPPDVPDSFRVYRPGRRPSDDDDASDTSSSLSTCYSRELSEVETDDSHSDDDSATAITVRDKDTDEENGDDKDKDKDGEEARRSRAKALKPLKLVWAKCRGYPWYPALIIDPSMPKNYVHNGVPIPSPPNDVLALKGNHSEKVYLVLFFDVKRTWQWLPEEKLEMLGLNVDRDEAKANEPKKPADRKAVKRAYENALQYQTEVCQKMDVDVVD